MITAVILAALLAASGYLAQRLALLSWDAVAQYRTPFADPLPAGSGGPPLASRVLLIVVDGLRVDASRAMTALARLRLEGAGFVAVTSEPSLSYPGWTAIASGTPPEISGVTTNWYAGAVTVDHLFASARRSGLPTALAGSPGWGSLFAGSIDARVLVDDPATYRNAEQAYRVSADVAAGAQDLLAGDAALLLVHFPSVDIVGHGFGGVSAEYTEAVRRVDGHIAELLDRVDLTTTAVIVTADHGHLDRGGHGGWEPVVKRVPLVLAGSGVRAGIQGGDALLLDVAPTAAALLGIGIPAHSQGRPLVEALQSAAVASRWAQQQVVFHGRYAARVGGPVRTLFTPQQLAVLTDADADAVSGLAAEVRRQTAAVKDARLAAERWRRLPVAALFVLIPLLYLVRYLRRWSLLTAAVGAVAFFTVDYALFYGRGYDFSLSVFNTESRVMAFFGERLLDAAIGVAAGAAVVGLLSLRRSAGDTASLAVDAAVLAAYALLVQVAYFYWRWDVRFAWYLPDLRLGFKYYLDLLKLVPAGLLAAPAALFALAVRGVGRTLIR